VIDSDLTMVHTKSAEGAQVGPGGARCGPQMRMLGAEASAFWIAGGLRGRHRNACRYCSTTYGHTRK
jgi:hypothetical protein